MCIESGTHTPKSLSMNERTSSSFNRWVLTDAVHQRWSITLTRRSLVRRLSNGDTTSDIAHPHHLWERRSAGVEGPG